MDSGSLASDTSVEICVVGGGPAGSTMGARLAALGHDVLIVEREPFPRPHIGESLAPTIRPLLDSCGVGPRIEAASFLRTDASIIRWGGAPRVRGIDSGEPGFSVDRGEFDRLLLEHAAASGARVWQPARAARPRRRANGWSLPVEKAGRWVEVSARFLVDAAGRPGAFERRRRRSSSPTAALYGYWRGTRIEPPAMRIEAGPDVWFWGAPLPDGSFNAVVFVDTERLAGTSSKAREAFYRTLLAGSELLGPCLAGRLASPVRSCDATCYFDEDPVDDRFIKVGEAAFSIDPLSSQGVQAAIRSAFQGAVVVHTLLVKPENRDAACTFYRARQRRTVEQHRRLAASLYAEQGDSAAPFWRRRARRLEPEGTFSRARRSVRLLADDRLRVSDLTRLASVPVLDGNFIVERRAVEHPALSGPVAFLEAMPLEPLVSRIEEGTTAQAVVQRWSTRVPPALGWRALRWLWDHGVVVPSPIDGTNA